MPADLAGEVGVKPEALEMDAQHLRKTYNAHLLLTVLKATRKKEKKIHKVIINTYKFNP